MADKEYTASKGETLCQIAMANGFPDCKKLRAANPKLQDVGSLEGGEKVTIPDRKINDFQKAVEKLWNFVRPNFPPPRIEFIREEGKGYGHDMVPKKNLPGEDTVRTMLAVTNYVSDRGGNGKTAGDFPADNFYEYDEKGSKDADHFKVQVYDNGAKGNEVKVNLYALRPAYIRYEIAGKTWVVLHDEPGKYKRPTAAARKLEDLVCKRVGKTNYFRSPYLRLVSTESSRAKRPKQCLLVGSYWDDAADTYEKRYSEILHQVVEAEYKLPKCPEKKCTALARAPQSYFLSMHLAFWILKGTTVTPEQIRATVYKWSRATLAMAGIRPIIESIQEVDIPKNMLCVANLTPAGRGRHASGVRNSTLDRSCMAFKVDGKQVYYYPSQGDSPEKTADGIIAAITAHADLADYTCKKFEHKRSDVVAAANEVSNPFDILVFKADGAPATISDTISSDRPHPTTGKGGQSLNRVMSFTLDNFPVGWPAASDEQRILRWNFSKKDCFNQYVVGTPLKGNWTGGGTYRGLGPYGPHAGYAADVGPVSYVSKEGVALPFTILHEICHPLMHVCHAKAVLNDAGNKTVELMDGSGTSVADSHDATKHLSDAPIVASYELVEENSAVFLLDGSTSTGPPHNTITTPVGRLVEVGTEYGILRIFEDPLLDADINKNDVPTA